jgi:hypothetical protein
MQTIYISNYGDDKNDGITAETPVRSWERVVKLCRGGQAIYPMEADTLSRLTAEIEQKALAPRRKIAP